jgi:hypothetical protein
MTTGQLERNLMGIELYWNNDEETVILMEFDGAWTWDDMYTALDKVKKVSDRSPVVLGAILDVSHGARFPGGSPFTAQTKAHGERVLKMGEGGSGPIAVVGAGGFFRTVFKALISIEPERLRHIRFVDTMAEAEAFMAEQAFPPKAPVRG